MNIRFAIKNTAGKAIKEGEYTIQFSGSEEFFNRVSEREGIAVGVDSNNKPRLVYNTGMDLSKVDYLPWYTPEEREIVKKQIKELAPEITKFYGGESIVKADNAYFWGKDVRVSKLVLNNTHINMFFETKNPTHALLYLSIISGAFADTVAPTKEWADLHQIPHYLILETEDNYEDDDEITKSDAHGLLSELRKDTDPEGLFILAWCLQYDTQAYGAYTKNIPLRELVIYHSKYIDGKLSMKRKRDTPKTFIEYAEKWKNQQTRPLVMAEAYLKAGSYFNFIRSNSKKYETAEGTILGNTIEESVETLMKPKHRKDFEQLRQQVEDKWKE